VKILGIIPARYASTRFPAKLLQKIADKTIIELVYRQCEKSVSLDKVVVATDHALIFDEIKRIGGNVVMTSTKHQSGTDRCAEALVLVEKEKDYFDFVVNIQGDEPLISPHTIDALCRSLVDKSEIASVYKEIDSLESLQNQNQVKVIINDFGHAIYFSRTPIPFLRDVSPAKWMVHHRFFKHLGIYAFRTDILKKIVTFPIGQLEKLEKLEQLRWLSKGLTISMVETQEESIGIDTQEDYLRLKQFFDQNIRSV
jgi:3-deoxy-manno-octulosonate cytidylyltransferase (CMP-KDO synthetase)